MNKLLWMTIIWASIGLCVLFGASVHTVYIADEHYRELDKRIYEIEQTLDVAFNKLEECGCMKGKGHD